MKYFKLFLLIFVIFSFQKTFAEDNPTQNVSNITTPTANNTSNGTAAASNSSIYEQNFDYGSSTAKVVDIAVEKVKDALKGVLVVKSNIVIGLFITLFLIDSIYTFTKQFIEQNYTGIASMFIMRGFFGTLVYTLLTNFVILDIIRECTNYMFNATKLDLRGSTLQSWFKDGQTANVMSVITEPLKETDKILSGIWDKIFGTDAVGSAVLMKFLLLLLFIPCALIMYVIAMKITLSLFLKSIEWAIGTSVSLLGLAGYGSELTQKYASTSLQYLVFTAIDYIGTLFMFYLGLNIVDTQFNAIINSTGGKIGFTGLFYCILSFIVFSAIVKVGPDIIAGISQGSPSITPGHSGALLSAVGSMGGGAAKMASGGAKMIGGAAAGIAKGGVSGFTKSIAAGGGIRKSLASSLGNAAKGGLSSVKEHGAKTLGSVLQHVSVSHGGHEINLKNTGLADLHKKIFKTFDDAKAKTKKDDQFKKSTKKSNKVIDNLKSKLQKGNDNINSKISEKENLTNELNELINNNIGGQNDELIIKKNKELTSATKNVKYLQKNQAKLENELTKAIDATPIDHNLTGTGEQPTLKLKELPKNPKWSDLSKLSIHDLEQYYKNKE